MKKSLKIYEFSTIIEKDAAGYYFAYVPSLQGCYSQGKTLEEALSNIKEAIQLHVEDRKKRMEPIPSRKPVSLTSVEVKA
ncbi:MAG: type II toxin-antitoxin system HicB family antitoxin [Candidatus Sungbacteria bacterium]|uniref:Type II toxin-antitoxin system HicB family antitoxin n=1 Tax=Candidatus Sungiibacteriota bacterium TaxID=2750080 RepID=A0A9D6LRA0_9BACT|nr:type II toxin-antitoxin system HicB family antitoxin [Candidatus Sungbacteria bacterium]